MIAIQKDGDTFRKNSCDSQPDILLKGVTKHDFMKTSLVVAVCLSTASVGTLLAQPAYFTRILEGPVATAVGRSWGCSLVDYDNDGGTDILVSNESGLTNFLYHNDGGFQFSVAVDGPILAMKGDCTTGIWGDWDNDGDLDLWMSNWDPYKSCFFRNDLGAGKPTVFTKIASGAWVNIIGDSLGAAWGDYDQDGFLDLAVANFGQSEFLYRNDGAGGMVRISAPPLTSSGGFNRTCTWADCDGDGDLDLFLPESASYAVGSEGTNSVFRNEGGGNFSRITDGSLCTTPGDWKSPAWADYDNDGDLDLYAVTTYPDRGYRNALHRNNGDGTFTAVVDDPVVTQWADSEGVAWGDFDNDGYLDLFVTTCCNQNDLLFHNERDGTFTRIYEGDIANHGTAGSGCAWADLDNDGFLDLFVSSDPFTSTAPAEENFLYRNDAKANGNSNGWLLVRLVGTASNRSAIGAKIRAKATLWGKEAWQLREISGGSGFSSQNDLRAHFGLGDAAQVDLLRIEWPSGIVQELTNVALNQILTITEHQAGVTSALSLTVAKPAAGPVQLTATGQTNLRYVFEASMDLAQWTKIAVRTNLTGTTEWVDAATASSSRRFYRAGIP